MSTAAELSDLGLGEDIQSLSTQELLERYKKDGDEALKWAIVLRYEGLIKSVALQVRGVYSGFAQVDDIVNEGILTLLKAIDRFDPDKGVKFDTYISKRIRGMVVDLARKQDWIPRNLRQRAKEIDNTVVELSTDLGRYPTDDEVLERMGVSRERYQKDMASIALSDLLSLDMLMDVRESDDCRIEVPSSDMSTQPEATLERQELQKTLADGIASLQKNEQIVLSLYYEKNLHMKEIAQVMNLSGPRISQIHARAIQKLKNHMEQYYRGDIPPANRKKG